AVLGIKIVDGLNERMIQAREHAGFVAKALARGLVVKRARCEHLEREIAFQLLVVGAIDHAHAARADLLLDAVTPERLADGNAHPRTSTARDVTTVSPAQTETPTLKRSAF